MEAKEHIDLLYTMILIRRFEEKCAEMYAMGKIAGFCHLYIGQEAIATGAISALREDDYVITAYRDHGHALAKGMDVKRTMAELLGKPTGVCKGKGGSMHLFDRDRHFLGGHAIVASQIPLATGVGFAIKYEKRDQVVLCTFGEGAINQGAFHESLNLAALWKLPVIYLCENNRYAMGTPLERGTSLYDIYRKSCAYDMASNLVDGMDILAIRECVARAAERARQEKLPTLIEARTYRFRGHSMSDPTHGHYRTKEELDEQKKSDPILYFRDKLLAEGVLKEEELAELERKARAEVEEAVRFSDESPDPPLELLYEDVYASKPMPVMRHSMDGES
ncbi:MAG: pyruvate dehydrogenase (acetyl-transferring) E1 component subunit alpha [Candidatus Tectomicrobia bacterium]|uniref:Pyruvate dehydrogenase E1 component subunit alpha n=1 Tax=Tectimicrobiota bacterium TaxID=2528274 RepID=A0A932CMH5_UNCTE|nr:pyruvate dehydrogenase (acetyl-transferring) E1 component subunit alpha [Candidatus Tectomicrobia bacterium]